MMSTLIQNMIGLGLVALLWLLVVAFTLALYSAIKEQFFNKDEDKQP